MSRVRRTPHGKPIRAADLRRMPTRAQLHERGDPTPREGRGHGLHQHRRVIPHSSERNRSRKEKEVPAQDAAWPAVGKRVMGCTASRAAEVAHFTVRGMAELADAADLKSRSSRDSYQDAPTTAENFSM